MSDNDVKCWGCECEVPVRDGMHEEPTDIPDVVYTYPCTKQDKDQPK
jgi:hypothetical protein